MPVIFLLPWGRGRKPSRNQPKRPNTSRVAGLGKGLLRWRSETKQRLNQRRQVSRRQPTIPPATYQRQAAPSRVRPIRTQADPQSDPAILLGDFFQDSSALPQYQARATAPVKERPDGFDLPQDLSDLGVAPRRHTVTNIETAAGRTFVSRPAPVASPPPLDDPFDYDFEPEGSYVSMFDDENENMPTTRLTPKGGPETIGDMWRNGQPPRPRVVGNSPLDELDGPDFEEEFEPEEEVLPVQPVELVNEPTYDPNRRGLRRRGGPRRQGIRFQNPRVALAAGVISALMLAAIVFFIIYIAGQISKAPTDKYSVMFVPVANGPTYGVLTEGQTWQHYLGDNFLSAGAVNADLRFSNASIKDAANATRQAQNSLVDVLVWSYDDPNSSKLVSNLTLTPNGAYDPPSGRGRQLVERYLYDPATMVFVMPAPTGTTVNPSLSKLLVSLSHYYAGNYDNALAGLSELLMQNEPQNEPGLRMLRGNVEFLMYNYAAAIEDYNQVININNAAIRNNQPTPINPAFVHNNRAMALTFQGNYQEANKSFTTALSTTDKLPKIFWNYAGFLLDHTEMPYSPPLLNDQAIKLQNVAKLAPDQAVIYHYLGRIYYYLGNYDAAVDAENHARELDPNYLEVYYWMGLAKLAKGQQEAALPDLNGALDVFHWGEGRASTMESQNRQRWQMLDNNGNKTLAGVWDRRANEANAQLDLMRFGLARAYLEETRLVGTDLGNPFDRVSRAFGGKKAPVEEAGPRLQAYHDAHPNDPDANFYLGQFYALTGQGDPAPLYRAAKDNEKDLNKRFKYHQILAEQYAAANLPDQAVAEYAEYIKLDNRRETGYLALSSLEFRLSRFKDAAAAADNAIRIAPNDPYAYLAAGAAQVGNLQFQQAINYLDRALVLNPNLADAHFQRGMALFRLNRRKEALDAYSRALALDPNRPVAHFYSGIIYQENLNDAKSAITEWQKAVALDPKYADAWVKLGLTYSQINQFDDAIEAYKQALAANGQDAITHYYLGLLYEGRHTKADLSNAEQQYRQALAINPGLVNAYYRLAIVIRLQGGNGDDALKLAEDATKLDPKSPEAQVALGDIHRARQEFDKALPAYNAALALRKDYPEALYGRAAALLGLNQNDQALADINRAIALRANWADAYVLQGQIQSARNQLDAATQSFNTARQLDPSNALLLAELGNVENKRGNPDGAIKYYVQSLVINDTNTQVHFTLGQLYLNRREFDNAAKQFERVQQLDPNWKRINYWLGHTYAFLNRLPDAQKAFEAMIAQEDNYVEAHYELGNVLRARGQRDAALAQYDVALKLQPAYAPAWLNKGEILEEMVDRPKAIEAYRNALTSTDPQIRSAAQTALQRLGAQ